MPRADFYVLPESTTPVRFACDMAARIRREELKLHIHAASRDEAVALDGLLWTFRDISFLPHALADDTEAGNVPISVGWPGTAPGDADVLINLSGELPEFAIRFQRVVEPVAAGETARAASRDLYRRYREQGWELFSHQLEQDRAEQ